MTATVKHYADVVSVAEDVRAERAHWSAMPGSDRPELIQRPSGPDSWLRIRHAYFNASAAATLYGEHPFLTLTAVVRTKLAPFGGPGTDTPATRRGRHLEPAIAGWWAEVNGCHLYEPAVLYASFPLLATLDRRISGREREAVEIKTTSHLVDEPARYWRWQAYAQMACAELDRVHLAVLDATMRLKTFVVERDDDVIEDLTRRALAVMCPVTRGEWPSHVPGRYLQLPRRR